MLFRLHMICFFNKMASCEENSTANDLKKFNLSVSDIAWINSCAKNEKSVEGWVGFSAWDGHEADDTKRTTADMTVFVSFLKHFDCSLYAFEVSFFDIKGGTEFTTANEYSPPAYLQTAWCMTVPLSYGLNLVTVSGSGICFSNNLNGHHKIEFDLARPKLKS
ncbi:hypothetical protein Cgig2_015611 [Carnegiea gigantea]|uniref:Uncharacterized protein n=1 Tax=Carnegiea gigantea TaxID=171969 RepID=A0A9Q1GJN4_9CARY|nr:hypothetical protein Cgig2_015611 [Carnegiea gigantea]